LNLLTQAAHTRKDAEVGNLARSLVHLYSWSTPKLRENQPADAVVVLEDEELIVIELWRAAMGQSAYADT
jgi:hypothetical protein